MLTDLSAKVAIGPVLFPEQNISSLLVCGLVVSFIFVCLGMLSQQECRDAVDWVVYVTIACAFGIGTAMENSVSETVIVNEGRHHLLTSYFFLTKGTCIIDCQWLSTAWECIRDWICRPLWLCVSRHSPDK